MTDAPSTAVRRLGFLTANIAYALARPDLAKAVIAEIKKLL